MKTDPRYLLVNLHQTIPKVWLLKMVEQQSLFMHPFPTCCTRITHIFKQGRYSYQVMHLYSTEGLTCYWRIRGNE